MIEIPASIKRLFSRGAGHGMTGAELRMAMQEGEKSGTLESKERNMVEGVFHLGEKPVGAFMTHRSDIQWLDIDADPKEAREAAENAEDQHFSPRCPRGSGRCCRDSFRQGCAAFAP